MLHLVQIKLPREDSILEVMLSHRDSARRNYLERSLYLSGNVNLKSAQSILSN